MMIGYDIPVGNTCSYQLLFTIIYYVLTIYSSHIQMINILGMVKNLHNYVSF